MEWLPSDIQREIIQKADVPIDTYLYYRQAIGVNPKKLKIDQSFRETLEKIYSDRSKSLARKKKVQVEYPGCSTYLAYYTKNFDKEYSINIAIGEDNDVIKFAFRAQLKTYDNPRWPKLFTTRKVVCDVHTGQKTTDWMRASDNWI